MNFLQNSKQYTGSELERTFFNPILTGKTPQELGFRIIYNMPLPCQIHVHNSTPILLSKYHTTSWQGINYANHLTKDVPMARIKAESAYSASLYFSTIYEQLLLKPNINMEDLTGTDLEEVETALFRETIKENLRATMWVGDSKASSGFNTFDGFIKQLELYAQSGDIVPVTFDAATMQDPSKVTSIFELLWKEATPEMKSLKNSGKLICYVTSDIYELYEKYLDSKNNEGAYIGMIEGRKTLTYHGIPIVDMQVNHYTFPSGAPKTLAFLSSCDNLALAVNTADYPGNEVRMWYNPDEMENRQRACFMAGCVIVDECQLSYAKLA